MRNLVLAVLLLLVVAAPCEAKNSHAKPHAATVTPAIDVLGDTFTVGDSAPFQWSYDTGSLTSSESLWAKLTCVGSVGTALVQWEYADGIDDPTEYGGSGTAPDAFQTGPTPSWDGTTPVDCSAELIVWDSYSDNPASTVASDTFGLVP